MQLHQKKSKSYKAFLMPSASVVKESIGFLRNLDGVIRFLPPQISLILRLASHSIHAVIKAAKILTSNKSTSKEKALAFAELLVITGLSLGISAVTIAFPGIPLIATAVLTIACAIDFILDTGKLVKNYFDYRVKKHEYEKIQTNLATTEATAKNCSAEFNKYKQLSATELQDELKKVKQELDDLGTTPLDGVNSDSGESRKTLNTKINYLLEKLNATKIENEIKTIKNDMKAKIPSLILGGIAIIGCGLLFAAGTAAAIAATAFFGVCATVSLGLSMKALIQKSLFTPPLTPPQQSTKEIVTPTNTHQKTSGLGNSLKQSIKNFFSLFLKKDNETISTPQTQKPTSPPTSSYAQVTNSMGGAHKAEPTTETAPLEITLPSEVLNTNSSSMQPTTAKLDDGLDDGSVSTIQSCYIPPPSMASRAGH